jgi:hypothetical protein
MMLGEGFEVVVARLRYRTSQNGWKGPDSIAVRPETWDRALTLVREVASRFVEPRLQQPFLSAGEDGSVSVRWSKELGGDSVEVDILTGGSEFLWVSA